MTLFLFLGSYEVCITGSAVFVPLILCRVGEGIPGEQEEDARSKSRAWQSGAQPNSYQRLHTRDGHEVQLLLVVITYSSSVEFLNSHPILR